MESINRCYPDYFVPVDGTENLIQNKRTGEVEETINCQIRKGSTIISPEQKEAIREKKEKEKQSRAKRLQSNQLGKFYFVPVKEDFEKLSPEMATRLLFLSTFVEMDGDRLLHDVTVTDRKKRERMRKGQMGELPPRQIHKDDLPELMGLSISTVSRFLNQVVPGYIRIDENGYLFSNAFFRGSTKDKPKEDYQQFYIRKTRELYRAVSPSQHKQLGYVFKMLPFINYEYNVICMNPWETEFEQIDPIEFSEFCDVSNYSLANAHKLKKAYNDIVFNVDGSKQMFCVVVNNKRIVVNPRIFYRGSNIQKAYDAIYRKS